MLSFQNMEIKYGPGLAYQVLTEIECAAGIRSQELTGIDPETRLARAIEAQDAMQPRSYRLAA